MDKGDIVRYAKDFYGALPQYLWERYPEDFVLRHNNKDKWFAVIMTVDKGKLIKGAKGKVDIIDLKCDPLMLGSFLLHEGIYPAYHMNKANWVTVVLDGTADDEDIKLLMDMSYELTEKK